jgi:prolyl-tRNA synthetase
MLWSKLFIPTLRDDHPLLMKAGYMRKHDYLFLGRRVLRKMVALIRSEFDFIGGQEFLATSHASLATHAREIRGPKQLPQIWYQFQGFEVEACAFGANPFPEIAQRILDASGVARPTSQISPPSVADPEGDLAPALLHTPNQKTIADIAAFTGLPETSQMKTVVMMADSKPVLALLRGDHQLDESKLKLTLLASQLRAANAKELRAAFGADAGSLGPVGLSNVAVLCDSALQGRRNLICGANRNDYHLLNVTPGKDFVANYFDLRTDDSLLRITPSFHTEPQLFTLSLDRLLDATIEQNRDADGIVLPPTIAPFDVIITPVNISDDAQRTAAQLIFEQCAEAGLDALFDDRDERPGVKFKDSDLIGVPYRVTIGKKLPQGTVELIARRGRVSADVAIDKVAASVVEQVASSKK